MNDLIKIGDFSLINNISIQTLRYYDHIGLLKPVYVDKITNYRYYHINQSALVDTIQYLRQLDFSLDKIIGILQDDTPDLLMKEIQEQHHKLMTKQAQIQHQIQELELYQQSAQLYLEHHNCCQLSFIQFSQRPILTYDIDKNIYSMSDEEYEVSLREFKAAFPREHQVIHSFIRVGTIMRASDFIDKNWQSKTMFIFRHHKDFPDNLQPGFLPKGLYAVSYCHSFQDELHSLALFHDAIQESNYTIDGDYICEVIYEHPQIQENKRHMFIRIQVPVKEKEA